MHAAASVPGSLRPAGDHRRRLAWRRCIPARALACGDGGTCPAPAVPWQRDSPACPPLFNPLVSYPARPLALSFFQPPFSGFPLHCPTPSAHPTLSA